MEKPQQILSIGALIVDLVCEVSKLPQSGQGEVVKSYQMSLGGSESNVANIIRQLGGHCELLAPVGQGMFADFARHELSQNGFVPFNVQTDLDNGACFIMVEPHGERTMITLPGIERCFDPAWFESLDPKQFSSAITSGYELDGPGGIPIIDFLEANPHILFYYAPGPCIMSVSQDKVARINALQPVWHLNDMEARTYTDLEDLIEAGETILAQCNNAVVITEGPVGAHLFSKTLDDVGGDYLGEYVGDFTGEFAGEYKYLLVPSTPVKPVDTIGAGDSHLGALMAARNLGATWSDALTLANRVAAAVCLQKGALLSDTSVKQVLSE